MTNAPDDPKRKDISDVMREEKHRGRSGVIDTAAQQRRLQNVATVERMLALPLDEYQAIIAGLTRGEDKASREVRQSLIHLWYEKRGLPPR
jgi:hypothetical protein